jgi:hypothetical protein
MFFFSAYHSSRRSCVETVDRLGVELRVERRDVRNRPAFHWLPRSSVAEWPAARMDALQLSEQQQGLFKQVPTVCLHLVTIQSVALELSSAAHLSINKWLAINRNIGFVQHVTLQFVENCRDYRLPDTDEVDLLKWLIGKRSRDLFKTFITLNGNL